MKGETFSHKMNDTQKDNWGWRGEGSGTSPEFRTVYFCSVSIAFPTIKYGNIDNVGQFLKRKFGKKSTEVAKKVLKEYLNTKIIQKTEKEISTVSLRGRSGSKFSS